MKHLKLILIVFLVSILFLAGSAQAQERRQGNLTEEDIETVEREQGNQGIGQEDMEQMNIEAISINDELDAVIEDPEIEGMRQGAGTQDYREDKEILSEMNKNEDKENKIQESKGKIQEPSEQAVVRRSIVANSVQEMLRVAERNEGVGTQIREIARAQNQIQEEADVALYQAKERKGFVKFLIGSDNSNLNIAEEKLTQHQEKIQELEVVKDQMEDSSDKEILIEQIEVMKQVSSEIEKEITDERQVFSLFGWFSRLFSKRN